MIEIVETTWNNFPAVALESELMRTVMVPDLGGKIVSLFDKTHHHEWLVPPMRAPKQTAYGDDFVSQDMSGWDEMMPTINACQYEGVHLPDHGEVWSIPWNVDKTINGIILSVSGVGLAYHLSRSAVLTSPGGLELHYTLKNTGAAAFPYLWAAHPQFAADAHTRIVLPPEVIQIVNVIEGDPAWGKAGERHNWPAAVSQSGSIEQLDRVHGAVRRACRKFYVPPEQQVSWAALVQEEPGCQMHLSWSPTDSPYLGLWIDEGMYNSRPVAAFEPSSGYYDSLDRAVRNNRVTVLGAGMEQSWTIRINLSSL